MKEKLNKLWTEGLSIDETRFSVLVVMAFIGFLYALYSHYRTGEISNNLLGLVEFLVGGIVGINGVKHVTSIFRKD